MTRIRLLYLYVLAAISLGMLLFGLSNLLRVALDRIIDRGGDTVFVSDEDSLRRLVARYVAITVIALPVWLGHWYVAQRGATSATPRGRAERFARERRLFLAVILGLVTGLPAAIAAWQILGSLFGRLFGIADPPEIAGALATLLVVGGGWVYYRGVQAADTARDPDLIEIDNWRRLEVYGLAVGGLFVFARGLDALLELLIALVGNAGTRDIAISEARWWAGPLAWALASLVVGTTLWAIHWIPTTALADSGTAAGLAERRSLVRRFVRAIILLVTLLTALAQAGIALAAFIALALGMRASEIDLPGDGDNLRTTVAHALLTGLVYALIWIHLSGRTWYEEPSLEVASLEGDRADPSRIYSYLVALAGLGFFVGGGVQIISILSNLLVRRGDAVVVDNDVWRRPLAMAIASLVVGFATWSWEWTRTQRRAIGAVAEEEPGAPSPASAERRSPVRRAYLVIAAGVGLVILLISGSIAVYALLGAILAVEDNLGDRLADVAGWLVAGAFLVAYHISVLRADNRVSRTVPADDVPSQTIDLRLTIPAGTEIEPVLARLREALPEGALIGRPEMVIGDPDPTRHDSGR
jgi:phage shock protein PspC (stress-responsive transcriptional regulator)